MACWKGLRRVNIYLGHFMLDGNASFHSAVKALNDLRNYVIACHPVLVLLLHTTFLLRKGWLLFTLSIFVCRQAVL